METSVNNKCRAFTSLEQSRKLAEILPLESADMVYTMTNGYNTPWVRIEKIDELDKDDVCAWSLAALLGVLPKEIFIVDNAYVLSIYLFGLYYWNVNNGSLCFEAKDKDNLVDACYEIIIKLHEQKLI